MTTDLKKATAEIRLGEPLPEKITEKAFVEMRRKGVGGSDWTSLLDLPPYGCSRELFYDKTGAPADYPFEGNAYTAAGNTLEPVARAKFSEWTGAVILGHNRFIENIPGLPEWFRVNVDFIAEDGEHKPFAGEIKAMSQPVFNRFKKEGPKLGVLFQVFAEQVAVGNIDRAYLCSYQPIPEEIDIRDTGKLSEEMFKKMIKLGDSFWKRVCSDNIPDRLEPGSPQCISCPHRLTCWEGLPPISKNDKPSNLPIVSDPELVTLLEQFVDIRAQVKAYTVIKDELTAELKKDNRILPACSIGGHTVYNDYTSKTAASAIIRDIRTMTNDRDDKVMLKAIDFLIVHCTKVDMKAVQEAYPELFERHQTSSKSKTLRVF